MVAVAFGKILKVNARKLALSLPENAQEAPGGQLHSSPPVAADIQLPPPVAVMFSVAQVDATARVNRVINLRSILIIISYRV
jgi:hypothetical protein